MCVFFILISFSGCALQINESGEKEREFTQKTKEGIKKNAKQYTEKEFQSANVPLNEFVQISGEIIQSDREKKIEKGDRFLLKSGSSRYQVFNEQDIPIHVGDSVIVYGEYYGFIKAILVEGK